MQRQTPSATAAPVAGSRHAAGPSCDDTRSNAESFGDLGHPDQLVGPERADERPLMSIEVFAADGASIREDCTVGVDGRVRIDTVSGQIVVLQAKCAQRADASSANSRPSRATCVRPVRRGIVDVGTRDALF